MICDAVNGHISALLSLKRLSLGLLLVIDFVFQVLVIVKLINGNAPTEMVEVLLVLRQLRHCDLG